MSACTLLRLCILITLAPGAVLPAQPARPPFTKADFERSMKELSQAAQQRKRWDFLLTASPLAVPGATGSALNPIAVF